MTRIDLSKLTTYSVKRRKSKVQTRAFASPPRKGRSFRRFYDGLPDFLAVRSLRAVATAIVEARRRRKPVIVMMGAHPLKVGLSPVLIELLRRGVVTGVAMNGAGIIHDFEIAFCGQTSEEVAEALADGSFGMARETAQCLNEAIHEGVGQGLGIGQSVGAMIERRRLPYRRLSVLGTCYRLGVPSTVHVALGTDIIHQHPSCDGAATGEGTLRDFHRLVEQVSAIGHGGVVINLGSAVILPEVFLKAVSIARNLGFNVKDFTTAAFDQVFHYRPHQNVVTRPVLTGGRGYYLVGHHEIMVPLLAHAVLEQL